MDNSIFSKNLALIKAFNPELALVLEDYEFSENVYFELYNSYQVAIKT
jgi:hypothetical protein